MTVWIGAFIIFLGALGGSWFWASIGILTATTPLLIRAAHTADTRNGNRP